MAVLCLALLAPQEKKKGEERKPGPYRVTVRQGAFYKKPSILPGVFRKARYGEEVRVVAFEKAWAKCAMDKDRFAYIHVKSLLPPKEFAAQVEGGEGEASVKAEGYRGSRFDPKTEEEYSKEKNLGPAYEQLNRWCGQPEAKDKEGRVVKPYLPGRPAWKNDRVAMLEVLRRFRRTGNLGEFGKR